MGQLQPMNLPWLGFSAKGAELELDGMAPEDWEWEQDPKPFTSRARGRIQPQLVVTKNLCSRVDCREPAFFN